MERYDPVLQAQGYARHALFRYARYLLELKRFVALKGGMWLFSDTDVEDKVSETVYRVGWNNPLNAEEDSWLRRQLADSRHEEQDHFVRIVLATSEGQKIHDIWQRFVGGCECTELEIGGEACQVHATIRATKEYCALIDADWVKIADWYRPGTVPRRRVEGAGLYSERIKQIKKSAADLVPLEVVVYSVQCARRREVLGTVRFTDGCRIIIHDRLTPLVLVYP